MAQKKYGSTEFGWLHDFSSQTISNSSGNIVFGRVCRCVCPRMCVCVCVYGILYDVFASIEWKVITK